MLNISIHKETHHHGTPPLTDQVPDALHWGRSAEWRNHCKTLRLPKERL